MRHIQFVPRASALLALMLSACHDTLPPTAPDTPDAVVLGGVKLSDAAIRRDDSHFSARIRISRDGEIPGAALRHASSQADALGAPSAENLLVEGGYGAAGEIRFGVYWDAVNPSFDFAGMRAIGDRVELLDRAGRVISAKPFDAQMAEAGLPGGTLVGAFFHSGESGPITCPPTDPHCGIGAELRDASARQPAPEPVGAMREVRQTPRRTGARAPGAVDEDRSEVVQRYRKVADGAWRLEEIRYTDHVTTDKGPRVTQTVMQVTYGAWHRNAARDAARAAAPRVPVATRPPLPRATPRVTAGVTEVSPADANAVGQLCARSPREVDIVHSRDARRGLAILYQHGFCSDASTWDGVRPRLSSAFTLQRERAFSLATTERLEQQVDDLLQRLRASGGSPNLVIGHSLGGLLARRLGQRDPGLVSGVITIGSPHHGALGADVAPDFAADILAGAIGNLCVGDWLCSALSELLIERNAGRLLHGVPGLVPPVLQDLRTGSAFLNTLNTTSEAFPRAGIEVSAGNRWAIFRMVGDARSPRTGVIYGYRPNGQQWVEAADRVYYTARFLQVAAVFMHFNIGPYGGGVDCTQSGYAGYWTPCVDYDWNTGWDTPSFQQVLSYLVFHLASIVIRTMDYIDVAWDWITTRNADQTDGLIALSSQRYPNSPGTHVPMRVLITPPFAESHAGETASPRVVDRTIDLVRALGLGGQ